MKITLLSGGSGNEAILKALMEAFPKSDIKVILNAYDNGKSTGECRKATGTLGVSDIRKNHERMYRLMHDARVGNPILKLYKDRPNLKGTLDDTLEVLKSYNLSEDWYDLCKAGIEKFFTLGNPNVISDWTSFNLVNMIYSGYYLDLGYEATHALFCNKLGIPDFVMLNSFQSVIITGITQSGEHLDEGEIVEWCNPDDPIIDIMYGDHPHELNAKAVDRILDSDVIIHSTGTFWSSLWPTMQYGNLYSYINKSRARKIWYVNTIEDKDSWGYGINWFVEQYNKLGLNTYQWQLVLNSDAVESLKVADIPHSKIDEINTYSLGNVNGKNNAESVKASLIKVLFPGIHFSFDWDDTIRSRDEDKDGGLLDRIELLNRLGAKKAVEINSGNNLDHILYKWKIYLTRLEYITGCGETYVPRFNEVRTDNHLRINSDCAAAIIKQIRDRIPNADRHFELVTPTCIKYKHFYGGDTRHEAWKIINDIVNKVGWGHHLVATETGVGSIDVIDSRNIKLSNFTNDYIYFSDLLDGPDAAIAARATAAYKIDSVEETETIIKAILRYC